MQSSRELLEKLTAEVGPVFIVLDNIGWAFYNTNIDEFGKWKLFENFCRVILQSWLQIPKVFFLIAGSSSFLRYTNQIPKAQGRYLMPIKFRRVSLHRLRRPAIEEIIHKTFIDKDEMKTIKTHFCLDDEQVAEVGHLFKTTLGHPRSLAAAFSKCRSYEELVAYDLFDDRRCIDWRAFADSMESWAKPLASMMSLALNSEPVNLTQGWKDKNNREISYDAIAHFFDVSWDGTVDSARLYMPPYIQQLLLAFLYPLTEYLDKVANCRISLNYATILEWACLKRFQELFDEHSQGCPHKVLPEFFTEHQLFGMCTGVQFSKHTCPVPTATQKWTPETWWHMRARIENHLGDEYRLNLKPRLKSASPDALLMAKIHTKKLTVGLAVKNFPLGTSFGEDELKKEIEIFNKIFDIYESGDRLNVLIVCSTNYSVDLKTEFEASDSEGQRIVRNSAVYSIDGFPSIHEIILLNLSTPNLRAKFFGIQDESLQNMLESTIEKAQAEVESKK